jgi:acylphosphatase
MEEPRIRRHVVVHGRVHGVAFRASTLERARTEGVGGFVRNRPDGSVEAVFEGPPARVAALVAFCQHGPAFARVDRADVREEPPEGLDAFEIR